MWDIGSTLRKRWPELTLLVVAAANVVAVVVAPKWEIVPFHLTWAALVVLYGLRVWSVPRTVAVLAGVIAVTGVPVAYLVARSLESVVELTEIPLITGIFVAMIWHWQRYQSALTLVNRRAERQREFVRDAAHELRTPIAVAFGHAELILGSSDPRAVEDGSIVVDELNRLSRLSERLLLLAASDHPDFLKPRPTEIKPLLEATLNRWQATARRQWRADLAADGVLSVDPERIQIALDALIENAVKFTSDGDRITLADAALDGRLVIEVSDTGIGIPADQQERVFERFARADHSRVRSSGGTGLGLAIVKAIVEAHGGFISLQSEPGSGTSFRIMMPGFEPVWLAGNSPELVRHPDLTPSPG